MKLQVEKNKEETITENLGRRRKRQEGEGERDTCKPGRSQEREQCWSEKKKKVKLTAKKKKN